MAQFNTWSDLKRPDDWQKKDIPEAGGYYHLVAVNASGDPVDVFGNGAFIHGCDQYKGVIYIGKASNFSDRFWRLVRSWQTTNRTSNLHDSRKTWDADASLQKRFPVDRLKCRFFAVGKPPAGKSLPDDVKFMHDTFFGPDDDARKTNQPTASAVMTLEASDFVKYERCMGQLPPLNTKPADRPATLPDSASRLSPQQIAEADAAIEMGDVDNDPNATKLIEEHKKRQK